MKENIITRSLIRFQEIAPSLSEEGNHFAQYFSFKTGVNNQFVSESGVKYGRFWPDCFL